jgi:hypothetical protein
VLRVREEIDRRDLGRVLEGLQIAGEGADHPHPSRQVCRTRGCRRSCPGNGELGGDDRLAGPLGEGDVGSEQPTLSHELVAECAADGEVLNAVLSKRVHATPPGHGRTTAARERRSTLA